MQWDLYDFDRQQNCLPSASSTYWKKYGITSTQIDLKFPRNYLLALLDEINSKLVLGFFVTLIGAIASYY